MAKMKKRKGARRTRQEVIPSPAITLDDTRIVVSGMDFTMPERPWKRLLAAGALSIGQATAAAPGVVQFGSIEAARATFEAMFNDPDDSWGLDEVLPDSTEWRDPVGMNDFTDQLVQG